MESGAMELSLKEIGGKKILLGGIVFFLFLSVYLFKRIPLGALWNHRKTVAQYQAHLDQIDNLLARAHALAKQKNSDTKEIVEQKAQLLEQINELLKKSPLNSIAGAQQAPPSKLAPKLKTTLCKLDSRYRADKTDDKTD